MTTGWCFYLFMGSPVSPAVASVEFFHYSKHVVPHGSMLQNPPSVGLFPVRSAKVPSRDPTPTHVHAHVSGPVLGTCLWADFIFLFPGVSGRM